MNRVLDREMVRVAIERILISFQEESTTKWSSDIERNIYNRAYIQMNTLLLELGLDE